MNIAAQKASDVAKLIEGRVEGNPAHKITSIGKIDHKTSGSLCFLANTKYERYLYEADGMIVLVDTGFVPKKKLNHTLIYVDDVYSSFSKILNSYSGRIATEWNVLDPLAAIDPNVKLGENVSVGKFTVVKKGTVVGDGCQLSDQVFVGNNVQIGKNTIIHPGVKIYHDCVIGNNVIIHANVVIGSDGFGFAKSSGGFNKVPQIGNVIIEDDVEIGSCTTIDRATIGSTIIKKGAKLDNLIMVAHNVLIGENTVIAAQTGIAGSTEVGGNSQLGGQVGIAGHIKIAPGSKIQAKSGVASSIEKKNKKWYGYPVLSYSGYLKSYAIFKALPALLKRIRIIEKKLDQLTK